MNLRYTTRVQYFSGSSLPHN